MRLCSTLLASCLILVACSTDEGGPSTGACKASMLPGDLMITEVMVNPKGSDAALEWVEVFNASSVPLCLNGLRMTVRGKTTSKDYFVVGTNSIELAPMAYGVMATASHPFATFVLPESSKFSLPNTTAELWLRLGAVDLDRVGWGEADTSLGAPVEGRSFSLCGECRSATCNDSPELWRIAAEGAYDAAGNRGSPGIANEGCQCGLPDGTEGVGPGDLRFTEILANPAGTDGHREWFEVQVISSVPVSLAGLGIAKEPGGAPVFSIPADSCLWAEPGAYLLFAKGDDSAGDGSVVPDVVFGGKLTLVNSSGYLALMRDGEVLADLTWATSKDGYSWQWDPVSGAWCDGVSPFGVGGDHGSPKARNAACDAAPLCPEPLPDNAVSPTPGDLTITEVLANPAGTDGNREWFEVRVDSAVPLALAGLGVAKEAGGAPVFSIPGDSCQWAKPGGYLVLAKGEDPAGDGSVKPDVVFGSKLTVVNSDGYLALVRDGVVLAEASWTASRDGRSWQKDEDSGGWCDGATSFGVAGDFGTPGTANGGCSTTPGCDDPIPDHAVVPGVGDLRITEILANPAGTDGNREWFEVRVEAEVPVRLAGLGIVKETGGAVVYSVPDDSCLWASPGVHLLLAKGDDPAGDGSLKPDLVFGSKLTLLNSNGYLALVVDDVVVSETTWATTVDGYAYQYDGSEDAWCQAVMPYGVAGDHGTPAAENTPCGVTYCRSGGQMVYVMHPAKGGVVITEIYANTPGAEVVDQEWFEVYVPPGAPAVHLNGVQIVSAPGGAPVSTLGGPECLLLAPGQHHVLCRSADPGKNGGIHGCTPYSSLTLKNSNGYLALTVDGQIVDEVADCGVVKDGVSTSLSPLWHTAEGNDHLEHWCDAKPGSAFGPGPGVGTPGGSNADCP